MASSMLRLLKRSTSFIGSPSSSLNFNTSTSSSPSLLKSCSCFQLQKLGYANAATYHGDDEKSRNRSNEAEFNDIPTEGISRPMTEIFKQLNKKVPDSLISVRPENGVPVKYIPWHIVNRIMNLHAPEWSGEVRNITYSTDGKSVTVVYRVTLHGTDAEIHRESTGTALVEDKGYGDAVQKAEGMAFRRACARLGLGLHLYHEDLS